MAEEIIFPNKIRIVRKLRGKTMDELAKYMGLSLSAISKIEKGYRRIDQEQLLKLTKFFNCEPSDVFVMPTENGEDEVISETWKEEMERRVSQNENNGLKIFGAGLRYIRNEHNLTLADVANKADLAVSVYHRIEIGQREVTEDELFAISKAIQMPIDELILRIYELNSGGHLNTNQTKNIDKLELYKATNTANILKFSSLPYGSKLLSISMVKNIPLYGKVGSNGDMIISKKDDLKIDSPFKFADVSNIYAVKLVTRRLGNILPNRAILYVNPKEIPSVGDIAILYLDNDDKEDRRALVVNLREDEKGDLIGIMHNPDEKVAIGANKMHLLHKVIFIAL